MQRILSKIWIYWAITDILLIAEVSGWQWGLWGATGLIFVQIIHFWLESKQFSAFPVQVRVAYALLLLVAFWHPLHWLLYFVILGTSAMVLFDYCFLARFMSLMPWNHQQTFTKRLVIDTFFSRPVAGSVQK